jgi:hypothetical protein
MALVIDPTAPTTVYAAAVHGKVRKSTDGGATWEALDTGLPYAALYTIVIDPVTPTTLYAATDNGVFVIHQTP